MTATKSIMIKPASMLLLVLSLILTACQGEDTDQTTVISDNNIQTINEAGVIKFQDRLFNLPSPVQASEVVQSTQSAFRDDIVNPANRYQNYTTSYKQALNLGIYGADLAYLNIYEKFNIAADYFEVVKKLSQELNISNSFTEEVLEQIERNRKNKDSLLYITSKAYRDADEYLAHSERNDISILVLAGGWTESMYILTQTLEHNENPEIINRIGQQKFALDNLIELMRPYYNQTSSEYDALLHNLSDLALLFDGVVMNYQYEEPITIPEEKLTIVKSKSNIEINEYQLEHIRKGIAEIRTSIVN